VPHALLNEAAGARLRAGLPGQSWSGPPGDREEIDRLGRVAPHVEVAIRGFDRQKHLGRDRGGLGIRFRHGRLTVEIAGGIMHRGADRSEDLDGWPSPAIQLVRRRRTPVVVLDQNGGRFGQVVIAGRQNGRKNRGDDREYNRKT
jgi:hypothetical protein